MPWRLAGALEELRSEVNARWPDRSTASDGTIGDAAHQAQGSASDHNPWVQVGSLGVVRAFDITADGIDADWLAELLATLGANDDPRMTDHGYVIWNGRIASTGSGWGWVPYTGDDPHTSHVHVSVTRSGATPALPYPATLPALFDARDPWGVTPGDDDMTDPQAQQLANVQNVVNGHTAVLQQLGAALDQVKAGLTAVEKNMEKLLAGHGAAGVVTNPDLLDAIHTEHP